MDFLVVLTLSTLILMNHASSAFKQASQQSLPQPTPLAQSLLQQYHQFSHPFQNGVVFSSTSSNSASNCSSLTSSSAAETNTFSVRQSDSSLSTTNGSHCHKSVTTSNKSAKILCVPPSRVILPQIGLDGVTYSCFKIRLIASRK